MTGLRTRTDPALRFWPKVNKAGPVPGHRNDLGPCWVWTAGRSDEGYGRFWDGDETRMAHRWAYIQAYGAIPTGLEIDHLCRNRGCVNPDHLEAVTNAENSRRTGPFRRGVAVGAALDLKLRTHCPHGHAYDEANTYRSKSGRRHCRACARRRWHERTGR